MPELPKSSRRRSSTGTSAESPSKEKSDKPKQSRRSSRNGTKDLLDGSKTSRNHKDPSVENEPPSDLPEIPKKTRRKKSKDASVGGSSSRSRSRSKVPASEGDGGSEMISKSSNSGEQVQTRALSPSWDGEESAFSGIS